MPPLRRCAPTARPDGRGTGGQMARWPWNAWPDERGLGGRMAWNPHRIPIVVLSNNDGCVIARSAEAKAHIEMGAPWHKIKKYV